MLINLFYLIKKKIKYLLFLNLIFYKNIYCYKYINYIYFKKKKKTKYFLKKKNNLYIFLTQNNFIFLKIFYFFKNFYKKNIIYSFFIFLFFNFYNNFFKYFILKNSKDIIKSNKCILKKKYNLKLFFLNIN